MNLTKFLFSYMVFLLMLTGCQAQTHVELSSDVVEITNHLKLRGVKVDSISTDTTFSDASDFSVPTAQAVKSYVDGAVSGGGGVATSIYSQNDTINEDRTVYIEGSNDLLFSPTTNPLTNYYLRLDNVNGLSTKHNSLFEGLQNVFTGNVITQNNTTFAGNNTATGYSLFTGGFRINKGAGDVALISDSSPVKTGLMYDGDYSASFVDSSLVSKKYVDDEIAANAGGGGLPTVYTGAWILHGSFTYRYMDVDVNDSDAIYYVPQGQPNADYYLKIDANLAWQAGQKITIHNTNTASTNIGFDFQNSVTIIQPDGSTGGNTTINAGGTTYKLTSVDANTKMEVIYQGSNWIIQGVEN